MKLPVSVIDLFAGPGGLGEGFAATADAEGATPFRIRLSIEKDPTAHATLELRAFFRQFPRGKAPDDYYRHLRGELSREALFAAWPGQAASAQAEAWHAQLGKTDPEEVHRRIAAALAGAKAWVLIGGPPCQAYSVVGRSRRKGVKAYDAAKDERQSLYVEYLQIIADHRPAVFVMENVKGLLSARLNEQGVFARMLEDLRAPAVALAREGRRVSGKGDTYRVHSLVTPATDDATLTDYVVRAERYGVPQARHRVILLGVREDTGLPVPELLRPRDPVPVRSAIEGLPRFVSADLPCRLLQMAA